MGSIRSISNPKVSCDIPKNFVITLKEKYNIENFIETGTFKGNTSSWAANYFKKVITIEASDKFYEESQERFQKENKNNIFLYKGISHEILLNVDKLEIDYLHNSTIFWLDSHWSSGGTFGDEIPHPLIKELSLIKQSNVEHFIFIDDLRLFSHPCKVGYTDEWPLLGDIFWELTINNPIKYNFSILGDCLFAFPNKKNIKLILNDFREELYMNYL